MSDEYAPPSAPLLSEPPREKALPFGWLWPLVSGAATGVALRLIYAGRPGEPYETMLASFIFLAPALVGMVTVYVAERQKRRTWWYYAWAPAVANALFVVGSLMILIEGIICAVVIVPLFCLLGVAGGLIMGAICRATDWPKQTLGVFAVLPLVLGAFEHRIALPERVDTIERTVFVAAPPARVWGEIWNARDIKASEVERGFIYRIGVPMPLAGITRMTPDGPVRTITMGKGIRFDQLAVAWEPERFVDYRYRFAPDSFPPHALDDHVTIGGRYFDLRATSYTLVPRGEGTELRVAMGYRVSTRFNWYAAPLARLLIGNFEETVLEFYRHRAEAPR